MSRPDDLQARFEALRARGAARLAPLRSVQIETLLRRLPGQPPAVQSRLREKIEAGIADLAQQLDSRMAALPGAPIKRIAVKPSLPESVQPHSELGSVTRFRRAWSRGRAHERLLAATAQRPANAGPLNSHALVLRSLELMQSLSGDYLRRFVAHAESLVWLEAALAANPAKAKRVARAGSKK